MGAADAAARLDRLAPVDRGAAHMAADRARLEAVAAGREGASFRLYRWAPACVSLGLGQPEGVVPAAVLAAHGLDLVRRPTGGRGLLHARGDLTYSVVLPAGHPVARLGVMGSYRVITGAVARALAAVGVGAELVCGRGGARRRDREDGEHGPGARYAGPRAAGACFEEHLVETLLAGGRKLCGSAQARRRGALLQHGAIPLRVDLALQAALFRPELAPEEGAAQLAARMTGLLAAAPGAGPGLVADLAEALRHQLEELVAGGPMAPPREC